MDFSSENKTPLKAAGAIPALDSLRGFAILVVVFFHGLQGRPPVGEFGWAAQAILHVSAWGQAGVHLFFVLSGFLITGILIDAKAKPHYFRRFYERRARRILPAYFTILALLKATRVIDWKFLLASILFIANSPGAIGAVNQYGSFWSLAVEEQFYLLWPLLVWRMSLPRLVRWIPLFITAFFALQFSLAIWFPAVDRYYKLWGNAPWLLAGAWPAAAIRSRDLHCGNVKRWIAAFSAAGVLTLPVLLVRQFEALPFVFFSVAMVLRAVLRHSLGNESKSEALAFFGYISYGLYLLHPFVYLTWDQHVPGMTGTLGNLLASTWGVLAISSAIAWISRRYWEDWFLRVKTQAP